MLPTVFCPFPSLAVELTFDPPPGGKRLEALVYPLPGPRPTTTIALPAALTLDSATFNEVVQHPLPTHRTHSIRPPPAPPPSPRATTAVSPP